MKTDIKIFEVLIHQVYEKTFHKPISKLSGSEREFLSDRIEKSTNQIISGKTLYSYVERVINKSEQKGLPRLSTLNILCFYLVKIDNPENSIYDKDHPYWYNFRKIALKDHRFKSKYLKLKMWIQNPPLRKRINIFLITSFGLIFLYCISIKFLIQEENPFYYGQKFTNSDITHLKSNGWYLINENLRRWSQDLSQNILLMRTYQGDSFLDDPVMEPLIDNILTHKINCGECCEVYLKLVDFNPYQKQQQAGFFIFNGNPKDGFPSIRYTVQGKLCSSFINGIVRKGKFLNNAFLTNQPRERVLVTSDQLEDWKRTVDSVVLKIKIEGNQYTFSRKIDNEDFITIRTLDFDFPKPTHVGVAAFSGFALIPPVIPVPDSIEAKFEYLYIQPCQPMDD